MHLPALSVLNVLNMPEVPDGVGPLRENKWRFETIERIANEVFKIPSKLSLLVFGRNYMYIDRLESQGDTGPPQQCFVRSALLDSRLPRLGTTAAVPIDRNVAKYLVPECDLLDYKFDYEGQ